MIRSFRIWRFFLLLVPALLSAKVVWAVETFSIGDFQRRIQEAYVAYYGRPADPQGLGWWSLELARYSGDLTAVIQQFGTSDEFTSRYGHLDYAALIDAVYLQMFNRSSDSEGREFYISKLSNDEMTLQTITLNILDGAENEDATIIENKVEVADFFSREIERLNLAYGSGEIAAAKDVLDQVHIDRDSVVAAIERTDQTVADFDADSSWEPDIIDRSTFVNKALIWSRGSSISYLDTQRVISFFEVDGTYFRYTPMDGIWEFDGLTGQFSILFDDGERYTFFASPTAGESSITLTWADRDETDVQTILNPSLDFLAAVAQEVSNPTVQYSDELVTGTWRAMTPINGMRSGTDLLFHSNGAMTDLGDTPEGQLLYTYQWRVSMGLLWIDYYAVTLQMDSVWFEILQSLGDGCYAVRGVSTMVSLVSLGMQELTICKQ